LKASRKRLTSSTVFTREPSVPGLPKVIVPKTILRFDLDAIFFAEGAGEATDLWAIKLEEMLAWFSAMGSI